MRRLNYSIEILERQRRKDNTNKGTTEKNYVITFRETDIKTYDARHIQHVTNLKPEVYTVRR